MKKELEHWLKERLELYDEIDIDKMDYLLQNSISNKLYKKIPFSREFDSHLEKVNYMMKMLDELNKLVEKTKLTLVIADSSNSSGYVEYLSTDFDVTVIDIKDVKNKKDVDLVLFTGGEDVNPELYGEKIGKYTHINTLRDEKEIDCFYFFKGIVPMLGICRGNQLLCVLNHGKLIQHVEGHDRDHSIVFKNNPIPAMITSTHHQMIYPFDLKDEEYELIAHSEYFKSKTYLNGNNEEIVRSKNFLEPEIIFYPKTKCLGIQGHPEYSNCNTITKKLCMNIIKKYLFDKKNTTVFNNHIKFYDNQNEENSYFANEKAGDIMKIFKYSHNEINLENSKENIYENKLQPQTNYYDVSGLGFYNFNQKKSTETI